MQAIHEAAEFPIYRDPRAWAESLRADDWLSRKKTAEALTAIGYQTSPATLATKATRGGGPPYRLFGRLPQYKWRDALRWAENRTTEPVANTSEAKILPARETA